MNELMITFAGGYLYYRTNATSAAMAFLKYYRVIIRNGINDDNMKYDKGVLRNERGETIDTIDIRKEFGLDELK